MNSPARPAIAIVGLACRFPGAEDPHEFWTNVAGGKTSFRPIPADRWHHATFYNPSQRATDKTWAHMGGFLDDVRSFAALHYGIAPRRLEVTDPQHRLLIEATRAALEDAGYERRAFDRGRVGVYSGVSVSEYKNLLTARLVAMQALAGDFGRPAKDPALRDAVLAMTERLLPTRAFSIPGVLSNMAAASVSQTFDFGGPSFTVDAACAAGSAAIANAIVHLRAGLVDVAFAGGAYLNLTPDNLIGFTRVGAISPSDACRPFDARADGFLQGEGVGVLMLKRLDDALRDGDRIAAVIRGVGMNNDGRGEGPMTPRKDGQLAALRAAYRDAEISPATVGFFEAHGTGTQVGDPVEIASLGTLLTEAGVTPERAPRLGSVKANIGHAMSAAGVAGLIKIVKALEHGQVPPQPGFGRPHESLELDRYPIRIATELAPLEERGAPPRAAVSAFGFGGTNVHLVVEAAPARPRRPGERSADAPEALVVSAPTRPLLAAHLAALADAVEGPRARSASLADVAYTLAHRGLERFRVVIECARREELPAALRGAAAKVSADEAELYDGETLPPPKVAFLFPGQGAQRVGLGQDLAARFPRFRAALERADRATAARLPRPLTSYLFAPPSAEAALELTRTDVCQPALAALGLAAADLLADAGVEPIASLGHSLGEFVALGAAGALPLEATVSLVAERGALMREVAGEDPGTMAAVSADVDAVRAAIAGIDGVWVANVNHPRQVSISGTRAGVLAATARLGAAGHKVQPLQVSHAFHSPLIAGVTERLAPAIAALPLAPPRHLVLSGVDPSAYGEDLERARRVLDAHATSTVDFARGVRAAAEAGANVFVHLGPGTTLLGLARASLGTQGLRYLPTMSEDGDLGLGLLASLARLLALGVPVRFDRLFAGEGRSVVDLPLTPLVREPYWVLEDEPQILPTLDQPLPADGVAVQPPVGGPMTAPKTPSAPAADPALLELFREQAAILRSHAEILAAQTRALLGAAVVAETPAIEPTPPAPARVSVAPVSVAPVSSAAPVEAARVSTTVAPPPTPPTPPAATDDAPLRVIRAVAKVSAFPPDSIKPEQRLVDELGFDSIMVADLGRALDAEFPKLGGLPEKLFGLRTTVGEVVEAVTRRLAGSAEAPKPARAEAPRATLAAAPPSEVVLHRPTLVQAARPALGERAIAGETWLLVEDESSLAPALRAALEARSARVLRVRFVDELEAPNTLSFDGLNVWPAAAASALAETVARAGITLGGVLFLAPTAGARTLHALVRGLSFQALTVVTRLGGTLGLSPHAHSPRAAELHGYAKALAKERPGAAILAADVEVDAEPGWLADELLAETLGGARALEVAFRGRDRRVVELRRAELAEAGAALRPGEVVWVTGGAGELGAEVARAIAAVGPAGLLLLGRRPKDAAIDRLLAGLGPTAAYRAVDLTRAEAVATLAAELPPALARPTLLIHAAATSDDQRAEEKSLESFDGTVRTKIDAAEALLAGFPSIARVVLFSSWAGRFGNAHQTDYSAANAGLDALASAGPGRLSIEWPPIESSGMVSRIPQLIQGVMREEGVTFLPKAGVSPLLLRALAAGAEGILLVADAELPARTLGAELVERVSLETHPYLDDHRLKGRPILPLASATDLLAGAAARLLATDALEISGLELVRPIDATEPVDVTVRLSGTSARLRGELRAGGQVAYRAELRPRGEAPARAVPGPTDPRAPGLTVAEFYDRFAFHGPSFRGIVEVLALGDQGIAGVVGRGDPARLRPGAADRVQLDPLMLDGAFQLAGLWAADRHGKVGYPTAFERLVLAGAPRGDRVRVTIALDEASEDRFVGSLALADLDGRVFLTVERLAGRFTTDSLRGKAVDVPVEHYDVASFPEVEALEQRLEMARLVGLENPYFVPHHGTAKNRSLVRGVEMINYSSYNYLGLSGHPEVIRAAQEAVERYGTSVSASRIASGERPLHRELELAIAEHVGVDDAIVYVGGHATNVSTIGTIVGPDDLVLHDQLAHDSILQGIRLSGAKRRPYAHEDMDALERLLGQLRKSFRRVLITAEGIYSMDGDVTHLPRLIELKKRHRALLLVDEAHSIGVLGHQGRGVGHHFPGVNPRDVDLWMGTMSKSFASCGGYIAGSHSLVKFLKYSAGGFVYSVGMAPPNAAAAKKALELMQAHPELSEGVRRRSQLFLGMLKKRKIDTGLAEGYAVVPAIVGNSLLALKLSAALAKRGINVQPIVYPAVEDDAARLRFFISTLHTEAELTLTADAVAEELAKLRSELDGAELRA